MDAAALRVEHLNVTLDAGGYVSRVVDDVSFSLVRERTLCLVGESGCGKSLCARAILRLIEPPLLVPAASRILLEGRDLMPLHEPAMRAVRGRRIGMVFQEPSSALNPAYTVGNQLVEVMVRHLGLSSRRARQRAIDLFRQVGVAEPEHRVGQFPHELSGGMQQRVMIAIALCCEPLVLIADEPTTALDVTIQAQILDVLRERQSSLGMAMLLITHDLGVVAEMADDVAVMYAGSIVEQGSAAAVLGRPQHPYTQALLRSMPRPGMRRDRAPLDVIRGMVPPPQNRPGGCRFAPRCEDAMGICAKSAPALLPVHGRMAACWARQEPASSMAEA